MPEAAPSVLYLVAAIAIGGVITLALRAVPFAVLKPLRKSKVVQRLGQWMPAGLLLILVVVVLRDEIVAQPGGAWKVVVAGAITVLVHLTCGRRTLLSVSAGTAAYVLLFNLVP